MKKALLFVICGGALFAAGYWTKSASLSGDTEKPKAGGIPAAVAGYEAREQATTAQSAREQKVTTFAPGRPFPKGQAVPWLLGLVPQLKGDKRGNALALVELAQVFLTMDEDSAREASEALTGLTALYKAGDNPLRNLPNADDMLEGAMMLTMIRLTQTNPDKAFEMLKTSPDHYDSEAMQFVFGRLAADNPKRAEEMALTLGDKQKRRALESIMYSMANKDPEAALEFAARHPESIDTREQRRVLEGWARQEPAKAIEAAVQAMQRSNDPELLRQTLDEWYKVDGKAAAEWAANRQGPGMVTAQALVLEKRARLEPQAVLVEYAALQQSATNPPELARLTGTLADSLAAKDLNAARTWAEGLPAGELQDRAMQPVAEGWVKTDAPAASEWIKTLPPGQMRDNAARQLINAISLRDPSSAFEWARSIQDENLRNRALHNVMQQWREQDPEAAKVAAETLPAEFRGKSP